MRRCKFFSSLDLNLKKKNLFCLCVTITNIASRIFFLMSSIFCFRSVSENPFTCNIRICLTIVDLPDSPAPSKSNRCVALYTCEKVAKKRRKKHKDNDKKRAELCTNKESHLFAVNESCL